MELLVLVAFIGAVFYAIHCSQKDEDAVNEYRDSLYARADHAEEYDRDPERAAYLRGMAKNATFASTPNAYKDPTGDGNNGI